MDMIQQLIAQGYITQEEFDAKVEARKTLLSLGENNVTKLAQVLAENASLKQMVTETSIVQQDLIELLVEMGVF